MSMSLSYTSASLIVLALGLSTAAPAPRTSVGHATDDRAALGEFEAVVSYDIATGGLAAKKAKNADVRQLGSTFEAGHRGLLKKTQDLAKSLNLTPTRPNEAPLAKEHAAAMKKLEAATAEGFDRAWIANEVKYHTDAIQVLTDTLVPVIQDPDLKSLVQSAVGAFQSHLAASQGLAAKHSGGQR
jgi:putative membrane protein